MTDVFREMVREGWVAVKPEERDELLRLAEYAEMALRSGLPLPPFLECDPLTQRAFIAASDTLRAAAAQRMGLASLGPIGAALSGADVDGGEAAANAFLAQQTALAIANVREETERAHHGP